MCYRFIYIIIYYHLINIIYNIWSTSFNLKKNLAEKYEL